ncbi:MAG: hypothetical protein ACOVN8_06440 [Burkholderiaceae bacterium]|jgi:hypothetical protein
MKGIHGFPHPVLPLVAECRWIDFISIDQTNARVEQCIALHLYLR